MGAMHPQTLHCSPRQAFGGNHKITAYGRKKTRSGHTFSCRFFLEQIPAFA